VTRRAAPAALLGLLLAVVLIPLLAVSPAYAAAKTITISLTADGPKPASTTAAIGDTIQFKNDDPTFVHEVGNRSTNWPGGSFDSGPMPPGQVFVAGKLAKAGEYVYEGKNLDSFTGKVVVPSGTTTSPTPTVSKSAPPPPSRSASPRSSAGTASASPTGGTGVGGPPPLAGGFGTIGGSKSPRPGQTGPAPNVAPTLAGEGVTQTEPSGPAVAIGTGRLPEPPTGRRYGLPAALAAIAAAGVASLLVRLLLAHPAAGRAKHARGRDIPVTID
jgi:plastocyanin